MGLLPDIGELVARARSDLRLGLPVIIVDDTGPTLIAAAETLSADRLSSLLTSGSTPVLALTSRRAHTLKARAYDGDLARIVLSPETTQAQVMALADPSLDLRHPMKGPLRTERDGSADAHRTAIALAKSARLLPAVVVVRTAYSSAGLTSLPAPETDRILAQAHTLSDVAAARVPMAAAEAGRVHVFRPRDGGEEHYAIEIGRPDRDKPVLARLHSACFTGDVLGSLKCDCGAQLQTALHQMGAEGAGILLYLNQEGRGIGLANKLRAYSLQDQGFDTVEANHRLGFEDDERDFRLGAGILRTMGIAAVRLMTNNPAKIDMMRNCGIDVPERVPLQVGKTTENADYLATKARKSGHLL